MIVPAIQVVEAAKIKTRLVQVAVLPPMNVPACELPSQLVIARVWWFLVQDPVSDRVVCMFREN